MFPFKVLLFQGCKNETGPINTKSFMQHVIRYQVLMLSCNMFVRSHCQLHYTHQPFVYNTKYCWRHITKCFELDTVCKILGDVKMAEPCERTQRNHRRNTNESLLEKSHRLRDRNETLRWQRWTKNIEVREEQLGKKTVSYTFSLFSGHQQVTGTDFWQSLLLFSKTCIQSWATICCSFKSLIIGLTKCCIWDERDFWLCLHLNI
jgi:hypothetical protein